MQVFLPKQTDQRFRLGALDGILRAVEGDSILCGHHERKQAFPVGIRHLGEFCVDTAHARSDGEMQRPVYFADGDAQNIVNPAALLLKRSFFHKQQQADIGFRDRNQIGAAVAQFLVQNSSQRRLFLT